MRYGWALVGVLVLASVADAQTLRPWLRVYAVGGLTPATDTELTGAVCNLDASLMPPAAEAQNPTHAWWDDPVNAGRVCRWTDTNQTGGPLLALPIGTRFEATLSFQNATGRGPESPRSNPFSRPIPLPAAPPRVRIGSGS